MPQRLVFVDATQSSHEAVIDFPGDMSGISSSGTIVDWRILNHSDPYFQIKFTGCLETPSTASGARVNMLQLPTVNNGSLKVPLAVHPWLRRFKVEIYGMGDTDTHQLANVRLLLWIQISTPD